MSRKRSSPINPLLLLLLAFLCISTAIFVWSLDAIPRWAEAEFGSPSSGLNLLQRWSYSFQLLLNRDQLKTPYTELSGEKSFTISPGETADSVAARLETEGLIPDAGLLVTYLAYSGGDRYLKMGSFRLNYSQSPIEIAGALQDTALMEVTLVFLPGWRAEEIAKAIIVSGINISEDEFLMLIDNPSGLDLPEIVRSVRSLEGFLYPDTYTFSRQVRGEDLVEAFLQRFNNRIGSDLISAYNQQGLTLEEAVILASIVERESMVDDEQPIIASVFLNRIRIDMKLDSDPTVQYAIGFDAGSNTWWKNPLSYDDLQVNSPFNTYLNIGLPPKPISNPGISALLAVAYPADTPYYYFRAKCDGSGRHNFAITYDEHLMNGCP